MKLNDKLNYLSFDGKIQDKSKILELLINYKIDTIIHFAAQSHVDTSFFNSLQYTDDNVFGTHILLECVRLYNKLEKFIHISTDEVYGENENDDIKTEKTLLCPTNPYSATKAAAEMIVNSYFYSFKIPIIIIRSNNVYGRHQYIEKVIPKFINQILNGEKITIQGTGENKRSFLYIDDFINGLETILNKGQTGNIYNISSPDEISIIDLAKMLMKLMKNFDETNDNIDNYLIYVEDRSYNDRRYYISDEKLRNLGWNKMKSLEDGLKETIEWYKNNRDYWN
jgi:dTDP-glucose 4,6-dehydratase